MEELQSSQPHSVDSSSQGDVEDLLGSRNRAITRAAAVAGVVIATALAVSGVTVNLRSQTTRPPAAKPALPNLNGIWQALNEANFDLEPHPAKAALSVRHLPYAVTTNIPSPEVVAFGAVGSIPGGLGVVEGGSIPYRPEALVKKRDNQDHWLERDPEIKCYLPGVPRATYMPYPFQIAQSSTSLMFAYEYAGAVRTIYLKDPGPPPDNSWMGQSVAHWEGQTLVIDVTGFNNQTWFDRAGNFHSDKLHVTERYTKLTNDHLMYEATIEDLDVFTRPWKISMPLYRRIEKNASLVEFRCAEFVEELLYGRLRKKP
jgi:hypothetical protein